MPTICALLNVSHPDSLNLDGQNIMPLLLQNSFNRVRPLSWFFYRTSPEMAMRFGDYMVVGSDRDTSKYTHSFTAPDMAKIKEMSLEDFQIYDLINDVQQAKPIEISTLPKGVYFVGQMKKRLMEIQKIGPFWENLPPAMGTKKIKSEWRQLHPQGFSN
jgi:arylsulfatase A